ncbi:hypothetical protein M433DRAFT_133528 [Acidomyces richmondensis BFW]|nr:hypothetical protein M433DRAFT_133528 [Acidomyces richmondensis BFW]
MATLSAHRSARLLIIIDAQQATDVSTVYSDDNVATVTQGHTVPHAVVLRTSIRSRKALCTLVGPANGDGIIEAQHYTAQRANVNNILHRRAAYLTPQELMRLRNNRSQEYSSQDGLSAYCDQDLSTLVNMYLSESRSDHDTRHHTLRQTLTHPIPNGLTYRRGKMIASHTQPVIRNIAAVNQRSDKSRE